MSGRGRGAALAVAAALLLGAGSAGAQMNVRFESPVSEQPVFGPTEVRVNVQAGEPIDRVEYFVNGKPMAVSKVPPYNVTIDVGDDNVEREFRAVAYTRSGSSAAGAVKTYAVRVDDVLNLKLRTLFVTVARGGRRDLALDQGDFQIFDNGATQEIVTFGRDELPLTAVLLLDTSESMSEDDLESVQRGAKAFMDGMKPLDEAMVTLFSDRMLKTTPFTSDPKNLQASLSGVKAAGGTAVNDFLYMSLKLLEARQGQRVVVLFSDGSDVHSVIPGDDLLWKARTGQALIYWIQLGGKHQSFTSAWRNYEANDHEYNALKRAVEESGGRILEIEQANQLEGAFKVVLQELRQQYALGYYPSNGKGDGSWHKIDVKVRGLGDKVRTREGYVDN
ncbi:MAG TPA: VWA domain-containing protein [Thermoanaerobaculia bacterium]|nr:VWA domain-containing protein [Thermoanaerobaculia bacterium]